MAKGAKKKNRKLRRQIRKTLGALLMVSAITVAAIPVQDISANPANNASALIKAAVKDTNMKAGETGYYFNKASSPYEVAMPHSHSSNDPNEQTVYTSGNGAYQFVYMDPDKGNNKVAVILQYNGGYLSDNKLVIPDSLEAYRKYTDNVSASDFCLVTKNNSFLYYKATVRIREFGDVGEYMYNVIDIPDSTSETGYKMVPQRELVQWPAFGADAWAWIGVGEKEEEKIDEETGETIIVKVDVPHRVIAATEVSYLPCYNETREDKNDGNDSWGHLTDGQLYYYDETDKEYKAAGGSSDYQRIDAIVAYIGSEKVTVNDKGEWVLGGEITDPKDGVFAGEGNIETLIISENIRGISDYAFYDCTNLKDVKLNNGLEYIGNGAFAECTHLEKCSIDPLAKAKVIGKDAFYNCRALTEFTIPNGLQVIGDNCFEGCATLAKIDFSGTTGDGNTSLRTLGYHIFKDCRALGEVTFPAYYEEEDIDVDMFEGCTSLQKIVVPAVNTKLKIGVFHVTGNKQGYPECHNSVAEGWQQFRDTVSQSFYFEGADKSNIHTSASDGSVAFKYAGQDLYEKIEYERDALLDANDTTGEQKSAKVTYQVNSKNELVHFEINTYDDKDGKKISYRPENITIPAEIGPYHISYIGEGSFNNNCYLSRITIPASVTSIGANAFRGCHNLKTVIFTDATTITSIGANAFKTQDGTNCKHGLYPDNQKDDDGNLIDADGKVIDSTNQKDPVPVPKPELYFVGAMMNEAGADTEPFKFAMNGSSNINNNNQEKIWITCHSGWPTNLEVQYHYDPDTNSGEAQLIGYPRYELLNNAIKAEDWVKSLPYVTSANEAEYLNMVMKATQYWEAADKTGLTQPTENEMAIVTSALNVVIPSSVDSIKPGLFSGYTYDENGDPVQVDEDGNAILIDKEGNSTRYDEAGNKVLVDKDGKYEPKTDSNGNEIPLIPIHETDTKLESILVNGLSDGVKEIEPYTFKDCIGLKSADMIGSGLIGDYAFEDCTNLANVALGSRLQDTGKRPFKGCNNLSGITCVDPSQFKYDSGILYRSLGNGWEIVECLENRGALNGTGLYNVGPDELTGVTSIKDEAFADCTEIGQIDLSKTTVDVVPDSCFKDMQLNSIYLPSTLKAIEKDAFKGNDVNRFIVYFKGDPITWEDDQFEPKDPDKQIVIFQCLDKSNAYYYAEKYPYITSSDEEVYLEFEVIFWNLPDWPSMNNQVLFDKQTVRAGESAVPPKDNPTCNNSQLSFVGWSNYENIQKNTDVFAQYDSPEFKVEFIDGYTYTVLKTQYVKYGQSATPPAEELIPKHEGQMFIGWDKEYYNITSDITIIAKYVDSSGDASRHKVTFYDDDGKELFYQYVNDGDAPLPAQPPAKAGYTFIKWVWTPPESATSVKQDTSVVAQYEKGGSNPGGIGPGGSPGPGQPGASGSPGPSGSASPSASASASPSASPEVTKYTVSVSGGSGSGRYAAGEIVPINAYYMGEGQVFDRWTTSTAGVGFSNPNATSATFTMPAANVAITATYKTGSGAVTTSTGGAAGAGGGTGGSGTASNNGTTVEVTKPGISNTNYAGATVSGATDNFIVKVTEDQSATDAVVAALQARYGDISRIKYLPMDISLYDSTGRTRIADTTGITVNLTLPIPDDLVQYAGNNKVAAIANGALEDLNVRFTTVGGVPCVNFTATHFSPYVIYVDTANLTEATIDTTPKTGDPIHPKWFLALGMACVSLILFFKRDKVVVKSKTKTA